VRVFPRLDHGPSVLAGPAGLASSRRRFISLTRRRLRRIHIHEDGEPDGKQPSGARSEQAGKELGLTGLLPAFFVCVAVWTSC